MGAPKEAYRHNLHLIAYNTCYLIVPWVKVPHLAAHLLGRIARRINQDWQAVYHHPIHLLESFVDIERFWGTCYRAANWICVGRSVGRGTKSKTSQPTISIKKLWVYPMGRNLRQKLLQSTDAAPLASSPTDLGGIDHSGHERTGDPPIQMCEALSRNLSPQSKTILAHCLSHGRREFVSVVGNFPEECRRVLESLGEVYRLDAQAKQQALSADQRLLHHQIHNQPVMERLKSWMLEQIHSKQVEPNSGLGQAMAYLLKYWEPLTLVLRQPGALLDNNRCEQALKMAIPHRKNSLSYKTLKGARTGDLFMSLIHTCRLNGVNPLDYLLAIAQPSHPKRMCCDECHRITLAVHETPRGGKRGPITDGKTAASDGLGGRCREMLLPTETVSQEVFTRPRRQVMRGRSLTRGALPLQGPIPRAKSEPSPFETMG